MKLQQEMQLDKKVHWYEWLPWLFLLASLLLSYKLWHAEHDAQLASGARIFDSRLEKASIRFENNLALYEQTLYGMKSLFDSSEFVSEREFKLFVKEMFNAKFASGLREVGFIKYVDKANSTSYGQLDQQFKSYIHASNRKHLAPIIYLVSRQPYQANTSVVDAFDDKALKASLISSDERHEAQLSDNNKHLSSLDFVMVLPVYSHSNENEQGGVYGWVLASLDIQEICRLSLSGRSLPDTRIRYALHRQNKLDDKLIQVFENVPNSENESTFSGQRAISFKENKWILSAQSLAPFNKKVGLNKGMDSYPNKVGVIALFIAIALTSILFLLISQIKAYEKLKRIHKKLELSDERWHFALEGSESGVWDWDIPEDKVEYSKRWMQMFGFQPEDIKGTIREWQALLHPDDKDYAMNILDGYLRGESEVYSLEYRLKSKDGSWKWVLSRGMIVARNEQGEPTRMVGTHADISELKESEKMIWQHANFDYLTNLPNRRMLYARLEREMEKCQRLGTNLALFFLDLDGFKEINDTLGHDQGDILLEQAAIRLSECTFTHDVVARLGGDEFVILVPEIEPGNVKHLDVIAQKILMAISQPFVLKHEQAFVSASVGIVVYPDDADTIDGLIKSVDQAMYASKERGGNCFTYFTPKMQEDAQHRLRLSNDLRLALDKQELFIEYQPIVELQSGDIYKAEALLRWQHEENGLISPAEFIPIAEDTRLINEIGNWVFVESIKQCRVWRELIDTRFQVSVNKSAVQFMNADPEHSQWLKQLSVKDSQKNMITVEITESLLLEPTGQVGAKLQEYRRKGVEIALDDFGTGYSSLAYLRKFEIDYLKIDRSFVANLEGSEEDQVLCKAIIVMAHNLGIKVVAEGIETEKQRDILLAADCDYGQGFYFSRPLNPEQFQIYLEQHKSKLF